MTKAVLILPGTALIYIPVLIQWFSDQWPFGAGVGTRLHWAVAAMLAVPALAFAAKTMNFLFLRDTELLRRGTHLKDLWSVDLIAMCATPCFHRSFYLYWRKLWR
ncbi:hypothetical protein [uncultured Ruegeria sp.]|uniref:hypothetical protein n=1 Tax=uncultured Ruegeria sp. TaxID=259304 RepID=UPI00260A24F9|nr:hypothetical protein [uncultured Ruegeria sp.]